MTDLKKAIEAKSDQLNAADLVSGPITIKIAKFSVNDNAAAQKFCINFDGDNGKPWKPCKGMVSVMCQIWRTTESSEMVGRSLTLFREPSVLYAGDNVGGIQISNASHISESITVRLRISRTKSVPFVVKPLAVQQDEPTGPTEGEIEEAKDKARTEAKGGTAAFGAWWNSDDGKAVRDLARDILPELKKSAAEADDSLIE